MKTSPQNFKTPLNKAPQKPPKGPPKQFQKDGHWIVNPNKTAVVVCACGNRYLKTRPAQVLCLRCMAFGKKK